MRACSRVALLFAIGLLIPRVLFAQASLAGVVKDTSGAVLPGVTVEAASPALIEKTRTAVTDSTGQYRIENLRPGHVFHLVHARRASARRSATAWS